MDEFSLIEKIKQKLTGTNEKVLLGIGDDCAVLVPPHGNLITTTDCLVESVHFDLNLIKAEELGHKALAVNLSDIAAMGGTPLYALVSLGIRKGMSEEFILKMYDGMKNIAGMFKTAIVGGNITHSPEKFFIDITLIGEGERYWTRSGAQVGDIIAVTGKLGGSALGLKMLQLNKLDAIAHFPHLATAHLMPIPRVLEAKALMQTGGVTSAIDISDGLSSELNHLSKASGLHFEIEENKIPFANGLEEASLKNGVSAMEIALHGGEDYELLVTVSPSQIEKAIGAVRSMGTKLTAIGIVKSGTARVSLKKSDGSYVQIQPKGWKHLL